MSRYIRDSERINATMKMYGTLLNINLNCDIGIRLKGEDDGKLKDGGILKDNGKLKKNGGHDFIVPAECLFTTSGYMIDKLVMAAGGSSRIYMDHFLTYKQLACYVDYAKDTEAFNYLDYDISDLMIVADSLCCFRLEEFIVRQILDGNGLEVNLEWKKVVDELDVPVYKDAMEKYFGRIKEHTDTSFEAAKVMLESTSNQQHSGAFLNMDSLDEELSNKST